MDFIFAIVIFCVGFFADYSPIWGVVFLLGCIPLAWAESYSEVTAGWRFDKEPTRIPGVLVLFLFFAGGVVFLVGLFANYSPLIGVLIAYIAFGMVSIAWHTQAKRHSIKIEPLMVVVHVMSWVFYVAGLCLIFSMYKLQKEKNYEEILF